MAKKKEEEKTKDKKILTILILMFPSLLIALTAGLPTLYGMILRVLLFVYQFILVRNVMDEYFGA